MVFILVKRTIIFDPSPRFINITNIKRKKNFLFKGNDENENKKNKKKFRLLFNLFVPINNSILSTVKFANACKAQILKGHKKSFYLFYSPKKSVPNLNLSNPYKTLFL